MKKITAILLAVLMLLTFAACGGKEENKPEDFATQSEILEDFATQPEILEAFYAEYYEGEKSGKLIRDFDGDGIVDMVAVTVGLFENGFHKDINIHYVKINGESAREIDMLKLEKTEEVNWERERIEFYADEENYIAFNLLNTHNGTAEDYRILKITGEEIIVEKHLVDPGYTSALGIFYEEDYLNGQDSDTALYYLDPESEKGVYSSYKEAIETEFKDYGFSWKLLEELEIEYVFGEKYIIEKTDNTELIFEHEKEIEYEY